MQSILTIVISLSLDNTQQYIQQYIYIYMNVCMYTYIYIYTRDTKAFNKFALVLSFSFYFDIKNGNDSST